MHINLRVSAALREFFITALVGIDFIEIKKNIQESTYPENPGRMI